MAADHSVLCTALPVSFYHIRMLSTLCLVSILIVKLLLSRANTLSHTLLSRSLLLRLWPLASPTQVYTMRIILDCRATLLISTFLFIFFCAAHTHTHRHSLTHLLTHPRLLLPINFCCLFLLSSLCAHNASSRRRCLLAHVLRLSVCVCVCVFAFRCYRRRRRRVVVVVAASSSWLLRRRRRRACCCCMQGRLRTNFNIIWRSSFAHSAFVRSLSLSLIRVLSRVLRALSCLILVAGWRLE